MAVDLRFITGIRWHKDLLRMLNNMTFIYDVNWNPSNSTKATFPVCFFHVKSFHEIMNTEISQKQMLFYNSGTPSNKTDPSADSGLLNVVADNIVIKPKMYKLDVIIPYNNLTLLDQSFVFNTQTAQYVTQALLKAKGNTFAKVDSAIASFGTLSQPYFDLIKTLITTLTGTSDLFSRQTNIDTWITNITHQPDYNKESLEVMWRMRHILKMKVWNSWKYKYVAINDIDITKEGTEDGVYEATLTVQEMPIVSMYGAGKQAGSRFYRDNPLLEGNGKKAIIALDTASTVFGKGE